MAIKSPSTYGEFYWAQSVEAQNLLNVELEEEVAPLLADLLSDIPALEDLPDSFRRILQAMASPTGAKLGGFAGNMFGEVIGNGLATILEQPLKKSKYSMGRVFLGERIDAQTSALLWSRKKIDEEMYRERIAGLGYNPSEWDAFYNAQRPYPLIPELMTWARYAGDPFNTKQAVWEKFDVDADDYDMWEWLSWQKLTTLQVQTLLKRGKLDPLAAGTELARIGWQDADIDTVADLSWTLPNAMLQVQGDLQQEKTDDIILSDITKCDIHPDHAQSYLDAILTKPSSSDIVAYHLRIDPDLSGLDTDLRKIGVHNAYWPIYRELAQQIPPIPDIITMAVREAFTPTIAARFGQYEDFPADFATWAAKKGLSEEWSKRYWAAHWNLPSPQQGFEMLHRGVIDTADLNMLLRAQDIMPFWRDKLTQIAYRPLTRVDVRRMYKLGVLDEREVVESYLFAGYDDENARRMAEFTVKQTLATQSKFTSSDIVKAFSNRIISAGDARSLLIDIGVRPEDAGYIVSTAKYKREWAFTQQQINGIRNLYKKREYDANQARSKLAILDLPGEQIDVLMQQWYYEIKEEPVKTWTTAQTLGFMKTGIITKQRAVTELQLIGYDTEHINAYMTEKE